MDKGQIKAAGKQICDVLYDAVGCRPCPFKINCTARNNGAVQWLLGESEEKEHGNH